jgi:hypothetical protein
VASAEWWQGADGYQVIQPRMMQLRRVMLCGDAELPGQADLDSYADAGTRAFLAAYGAT